MKNIRSTKWYILAICTFAIILCTMFTAFAEDGSAVSSDGLWDYSTYGDGVQLTAYHGTQTDVYIPASIESSEGAALTVTKLGDNLFKGNTAINSATLGEGIAEIGSSAFEGATNLVCIVTPQSLTTIGDNAFAGCTAFNSIILYDTVKSISDTAFANCGELTIYCNENNAGYNYAVQFNIPYVILNPDATPQIYTVGGVEYYIMNGKAIPIKYADISITDIVIPATVHGYPVTDIGTIFKESNITSIQLPNSIVAFETNAFYKCEKLVSAVLPESLTEIPMGMFSLCFKLESVNIPNGVTCIEENAFWSCQKLNNVVIPEKTTYIGENAFNGCDSMTSIDIPEGVTEINSWSFSGCEKLQRVSMGSKVTAIAAQAFSDCRALTEINIPNSVKSIGSFAFSYCKSLRSITFPENLISIYKSAFLDCTGLESVVVPDNVTTIMESVFEGCTNMIYAVVPSSVKTMYTSSFPANTLLLVEGNSYSHTFAVENNLLYYCMVGDDLPEFYTVDGITYCILNNEAIAISCDKTLTDVVIPGNVENYPVTELVCTFQNCTKLKNVTLPDVLKRIGNNTFKGCIYLTDIEIPGNVNYIGEYAFYSCDNITTVTIPEGVTSIKSYTFYGCDKLQEVNLPESLISIEDLYAFGSCFSLKEIVIPDNVTYIGSSTFNSCGKLESVIMPDGVTQIGEGAFQLCGSLANITLPASLDTIEGSVFAYTKLNSVTFPESLVKIGESAFAYCDFETLLLPSGLETIGVSAFSHCDMLTEVVIPDGVTTIERSAFNGCEQLTSVSLPSALSLLGRGAFPKNTLLIVLENSYAHNYAVENELFYFVTDGKVQPEIHYLDGIYYYKNNDEWIAFNCDVDITNATVASDIENYPVTTLYYTFYEKTTLTSVNLSDGLKCIGENAFYGCTKLANIDMPDNLIEIGENAFYKCTGLSSVTIPDGVTIIPYRAFFGCLNITTVSFPGNLLNIGKQAFYNCSKLTDITMPDSAASIDGSAFSGCTKLNYFIIPNKVSKINSYLFFECDNLTDVIIHDGVTEMAGSAFLACTNLKTLVIPKSVMVITDSVFPDTLILCVTKDSYAHTFAVENDLLYFVLPETYNPEISYGASISGTVTYTDGSAVANATVELVDNDGVVRETVATDDVGAYSFTYAEVGKYTIKVTDASGNAGSEAIGVKRKNVFEVFLAGNTNITLKAGWSASGTVPGGNATVVLTDESGNVIDSIETSDGSFTFSNVPNGSYIIKVETESGSTAKEITVFNGDVSDLVFEIVEESASVTGAVTDEDGKAIVWANVTVYNSDGVAVAMTKTDESGLYSISGLVIDEYAIVAECGEMRNHKKGYKHSVTLKGYTYIDITEATAYTADTIIVCDVNDGEEREKATIEGKVTAQGERQVCEVVLADVFRNEVARYQTSANGKYKFTNVRDGLYFITATTESNGFGMTVVVVRGGKVHGMCDIYIFKADKIHQHETNMKDIPTCSGRDDAIKHKDKIIVEKKFYDGLSKKEKKQFSKEYVDRLNKLCEWIANTECETNDENIIVSNGGSVVSGDELEAEETVCIKINIDKKDKCDIGEDGIKTDDEYIQKSIEDNAGHRELGQYYEISMEKGNGDTYVHVDDIHKDTDTTGKLRITMPIPDEYKGHKHYSFVHVHNGEAVTLVDLDDDPDTITFEVDRFSTFALCYSDEETTADVTAISYGDATEDGSINAKDVAMIKRYIGKWSGISIDTAAADVNADGVVNAKDVAYLKRYIGKWSGYEALPMN